MTKTAKRPVRERVEQCCPKHGAYTSDVILVSGQPLSDPCLQCLDEHEAQERKRSERAAEERNRERIAKNKKFCALPARFVVATLANFNATTDRQRTTLAISQTFAEKFTEVSERGSWLTLIGPPGTGKTYLASAIANRLLEGGFSVVYRRTYDFLREVKVYLDQEVSGVRGPSTAEVLSSGPLGPG